MTATTPASGVISAAPACALFWCSDHLGDLATGLHQRRLGHNQGPLQVVLEQQDHSTGPSQVNLSIRYCPDGVLADDVVDVPLDAIWDALGDVVNPQKVR